MTPAQRVTQWLPAAANLLCALAVLVLLATPVNARPLPAEQLAQRIRATAASSGAEPALDIPFAMLAPEIELGHVQAFAGQDLASLTATDGPGRDGRRVAKGRMAEIHALQRGLPDFAHDITTVEAKGNVVSVAQVWRGTLANGGRVYFRSVLYFTLAGGRVVKLATLGDSDPAAWAPMYAAFQAGKFNIDR